MEERGLDEALLRRARAAVDRARVTARRSRVLMQVSEELRDHGLTSRCAWCGRHRVGEDWLDGRRMPGFGTMAPQSHTICPDCVAELRAAGKSV